MGCFDSEEKPTYKSEPARMLLCIVQQLERIAAATERMATASEAQIDLVKQAYQKQRPGKN